MASQASISALVAEHGRWLMAFLLGLADNAADAEDAFQETWLRVIKAGVAFRGDGVKTYLARTARSVVVDRLRRRRPVESLDETDFDGSSIAEDVTDPSPTPGEKYEAQATAVEVRRAVASLPFNWRQVVLMRIEGEMEFKDIAQELGVPLGTALTWMRNATFALKKMIGGER